MPPKKRKVLTTSKEELLSLIDGESSKWSLLTSTKNDLEPFHHLATAYGLGSLTGQEAEDIRIKYRHLHRNCKNRWIATEATGELDAKQIEPEAPLDPTSSSSAAEQSTSTFFRDQKDRRAEVITINDTTDDDEYEDSATKKKRSVKGKGKAKATTTTTTNGSSTISIPILECSAENCSTNPRCLNWLGQDKWEDNQSALKSFTKARGLGPDPSNCREPGVPVGLRNLGATCYANSFLQVWFRDPIFRAGVYACLPPANGNLAASPLYQLSVLFTFLQSSAQGVYDPTPLVTSLQLDTGEQQDAQEFQKLFMSLLDHEFQKQGKQRSDEGDAKGEEIAQLITNRFGGSITYGTECSGCKNCSARNSTYNELEVTLKANCKLEDRITHSLVDEKMEGDNQYYCDYCQVKRDATRYTRLESLPPVLHFSLLRFVYSIKEGTRKKSQAAISYPRSIDMGAYLPTIDGQKQSIWYDLKGVLMHKGVSAHHGHYVAQVFDEANGKWFLFDDEAVTPIDDLNAPDRYDEEVTAEEIIVDSEEDAEPLEPKLKSSSQGKVQGKRSPTKAAKAAKAAAASSANRDEQGNIRPRSKDAYMLVYTQRIEAPDTSCGINTEPNPPALASLEVERLDAEHGKVVDEHDKKAKSVKVDFEKVRDQRRSVYRNWHVTNENETKEAFAVHKRELVRWLENGLKKPKNNTSIMNGDLEIIEIDRDQKKPSSTASSETLTGADNSSAAVNGHSTAALTSQDPLPPAMDETLVDDIDPTNPTDQSTSTPIEIDKPKSSSSTPLEGEPEVKHLSNTELLCEHGKIDPKKSDLVKRVSPIGMKALVDLSVIFGPELMIPRDFCRDCVWTEVVEELYYREHMVHLAAYDSVETGADVAISKPWLNAWRNKPFAKMHQSGSATDPSPQEEPYLSDVMCEHAQMRRDHKRREEISFDEAEVIQNVFPDWRPVKLDDSLPCDICGNAQERNEKETLRLKALARKEKAALRTFDMTEQRLGSDKLILSSSGDNFLIPYEFRKRWLEWTKSTTSVRIDSSERPQDIDNSVLLCQHQRLLVDLTVENTRLTKIWPASEKEWKYLQDHYNAKPQIKVWHDPRALKYFSSPAMCEECIEQQRKDFAEAMIKILPIGGDHFDKAGNYKQPDIMGSAGSNDADEDDDILINSTQVKLPAKSNVTRTYGKQAPPPPSAGATRVSARVRNQPMLFQARQETRVEIKKSDTVKDLKVTISDRMHIPTICQRLFFDGTELDDSSATVQDLGILPDMTVELFEVKETDMANAKFVDVGDEVRSKGKKKKREEGFGGTGLFGWETNERVGEVADEDAKEEETNVEADVPSKRRASTSALSPSTSTKAKKPKTMSKKQAEALENENAEILLDMVDEGVNCPACTFTNVPGAKACEICELPFVTS